MSRIALAVLTLSAFVVLAGCGSGPGSNEMYSGGDEFALDDEAFVPEEGADEVGLADEPFDPEAASELPPAEVAVAASPLRLWLTGGAKLRKDSATGWMYYPMKYGESRPIQCKWSGGTVTKPPVWRITPANPRWEVAEAAFNAMRLPPTSLGRNFLYGKFMEDTATFDQIKVRYGGKTQTIWVKVTGDWPRPGMTALLNPAGARLKVVGGASAWSTGAQHGTRCFWTTRSGILTLRGKIVRDYPNPPAPQWTADQAKLKFVGSSTGRTVQFRIRQRGEWCPLTAKVGAFSVTVLVKGA